MDILSKQIIDKNNFNVFIRDLSSSLNTNLKHIIEDTLKSEPEKPKGKKGKKPVVKKADLIRAEVTKRRNQEKIDNDLSKVQFLFNNKEIDKPYKSLTKLQSIEGIEKMKYLLLEYYWNNHKKDHMDFIISLYYGLKDVENSDYKPLIESIGGKLKQYEYKLYMIKIICKKYSIN